MRDGICSNNPHVPSQSPRLMELPGQLNESQCLLSVPAVDFLALPYFNGKGQLGHIYDPEDQNM